MSTALERRLQRAFRRLPQPTREASRRARSAALATLPPQQRRRELGLVFVAVAIAVVLGAGAASLAATGNLHVRLGREQPNPRPAPAHLQVPRGSNGIAVVAGGKLWLATRGGLRIEGMPVSTAELSPRALYAVVGIGSSLVALAPGKRRPWVQETAGRVIAAAWSPDGLKIAYVVARRGGDELRLIEGDGSPDRLLVRRVSAAKPSWRSDSLAVAYVDPRGRVAVADLTTSSTRTFNTRRCGGRARMVAYSPRGKRLAVAGTSGVALIERWDHPFACVGLKRALGMNGLTWLSAETLLTGDNLVRGVIASGSVRSYRAGAGGTLARAGGAFRLQRLSAIAAPSNAGRAVVAFQSTAGVVELAEVGPVGPEKRGLRIEKPLLRLHVRAPAVTISWR